ncbi:MAG: SpoIIE family protein phosphatase [Bacteroidia bacterium]|nr:SpoIIE family protein phosphatase [Bacteroidia bacterium]
MKLISGMNRSRRRLRTVISEHVEIETRKIRQENQLLLHHYMEGQSRMIEMDDSLRYARHLQNSLLPNEARLRELAGDAFLLNIPRDVLSGDFCWCHRTDNLLIIAVADCTGHGVPGALMSMLGLNLLNRAVIDQGLTSPSEILRKVDHGMQETFAQHSEQHTQRSYDGMDISLCTIDIAHRTLRFAGAMRPMFLLQDNSLTEINGARYPIGGMRFDRERAFPEHTLPYSDGAQLYLFSDGFADQFGGPKNKKFSRERLRKLIYSIAPDATAEHRRQQFHEAFVLWKGVTEQTDDVLVAGVTLSSLGSARDDSGSVL